MTDEELEKLARMRVLDWMNNKINAMLVLENNSLDFLIHSFVNALRTVRDETIRTSFPVLNAKLSAMQKEMGLLKDECQNLSLPDEKDVAHYLCSSTAEFNRGVIECYRFCRENMKPAEKLELPSEAEVREQLQSLSPPLSPHQFQYYSMGFSGCYTWLRLRSNAKPAPEGK